MALCRKCYEYGGVWRFDVSEVDTEVGEHIVHEAIKDVTGKLPYIGSK